MHNLHTCDDATCTHFHEPLWGIIYYFSTFIPIDIISRATNASLLKNYYSTML